MFFFNIFSTNREHQTEFRLFLCIGLYTEQLYFPFGSIDSIADLGMGPGDMFGVWRIRPLFCRSMFGMTNRIDQSDFEKLNDSLSMFTRSTLNSRQTDIGSQTNRVDYFFNLVQVSNLPARCSVP